MDTRIALTIAGSDSGGGAGIQADLKTFHQFGVYGTTVIVAVTAQNTRGVTAAHVVPTELVISQLDAVVQDLKPDAVKTGMLADANHIECVSQQIRLHQLPNLVVDPVMVATSGDRLLEDGAQDALVRHLLPLAVVTTPNVPEAETLTGTSIRTKNDMIQAGKRILDMGPRAVLVTGGHMTDDEVYDVLIDGDGVRSFVHAKLATDNTHGTGCSLSAAITSGLAHGVDLDTATANAIDFVHAAIASAPGLGTGHGPINHFVSAKQR